MKLTADTIKKTFFDPVAYKPNSLRQEQESAQIAGLERVTQSDIAREQEYQALNVAKGIGRIHIIDKLDEHVEIGSNEILVLNEVPLSLPPVAGVIISKPSTPLSHINLLVKGWGVPNAYIKNAHELLKEYDTWWVSFETTPDKYTIKRADTDEIEAYQDDLAQDVKAMTPRFNLEERTPARPLAAARADGRRLRLEVREPRRGRALAHTGHERAGRLRHPHLLLRPVRQGEQARRPRSTR